MNMSGNLLGSILVVGALALNGCAALPHVAATAAAPGVVAIDSRGVRLSDVRVEVVGSDNLAVSGVLNKRFHARGPIPGHLKVSAVAADGTILARSDAAYHRRSSKSGKAYFHKTLMVAVDQVKSVRVEHIGLVGWDQ